MRTSNANRILALGAVALFAQLASPSASAQHRGPVLHEPIPPDPREDVALSVSLDGDLPAAIDSPRGLVAAPDPGKPVGSADSPYSPTPRRDIPDSSFHPDRDTRRPDLLPYDDPFSPSTAPFKRLSAFDTVDASYTLSVRDPHTAPLAISASQVTPAEEQFFADIVVDLAPNVKVKIPSVGPGARVLRARAGVGSEDVPFRLFRDGADNWFIEGDSAVRVRLVMELAIPRIAFGGDFGNPSWVELPAAPPLPTRVMTSVHEVAHKIGLSHRLTPRENVTKLVAYFRSFTDSEDPPPPTHDIYLDLALSRKGVCRHRAFAFMVTAVGLGIPARMIVNEAHAWVEVNDGHLWRRIDLGGAGRTINDPLSTNIPYDPPPDPFAWPQGSTRGDDLGDRARRDARNAPTAPTSSGSPSFAAPAGSGQGDTNGGTAASAGTGGATAPSGSASTTPDERPASVVTMTLASPDARRGAPLRLRGTITAEGAPCGHVTLEVLLRGRENKEVVIGQLATDERGAYDGALVLPAAVPLGDYDLRARTSGDARCGVGHTR